mmetsp:Transcript_25049/g.36693  ORF Transcript_25049/g.36693 Transcript_25049/m.36693 type:complete len:113 (-) Transcript_25049:282-620(-)
MRYWVDSCVIGQVIHRAVLQFGNEQPTKLEVSPSSTLPTQSLPLGSYTEHQKQPPAKHSSRAVILDRKTINTSIGLLYLFYCSISVAQQAIATSRNSRASNESLLSFLLFNS